MFSVLTAMSCNLPMDSVRVGSMMLRNSSHILVFKTTGVYKTTVRYHLTLVRMTMIKMFINNKSSRQCEKKRDPPLLLMGM